MATRLGTEGEMEQLDADVFDLMQREQGSAPAAAPSPAPVSAPAAAAPAPAPAATGGVDEQSTDRGVYYDADLGYFTSANAERQIAKLREKYTDWEITPIFTEITDREGQVTYAEPILRYQIRKAIPGGLLDIRLLDTAGNETFREVERQRGVLESPVVGILASAVVPGLGEFFSAQLAAAGALTGAAATTAGNALAKIAVDVAMGKDLEDAVRDTAISAGISAGMPNIAPAISELVSDPNVGKIIQNAGVAAVNAAVGGKDGQGILLAAVGAAAGTAASIEGGGTAGRAVQSLITSGGDPTAALAAVGGGLAGQAGEVVAREVSQGGDTGLPEGISRLPSTPDTGTRVATEPNLPVTRTTVTTTGGGEGGGGGGGQDGQAAVDPNNQEVIIAQQFLPPGVRIQTFNQLEAVRVLSQANPNLLASMSQGDLNEAAGFILNNQEEQLAQRAVATPVGQGLGLTPRATTTFTVETIPQDMGEAFTESNGAVYFQQGDKTFRVASQDDVNRSLGEVTLFFDDKGRAYYGLPVQTPTGKFMTDVEKRTGTELDYITNASQQIDQETGQPLLLTPGTGGNIGGSNVFRDVAAAGAKGVGEQLGYIATVTGNQNLANVAAGLTSYGKGATSEAVRKGQNQIIQEITNAEGLLGKGVAALTAAARNPAAIIDWGISEGVQEIAPLLAGVGVGRAITAATKSRLGQQIASKYGVAGAVSTNAALDAGESAVATYQNVYDSLINRGFSEERASAIAMPAALASGFITLVTTAVGESELVAAATRGIPGRTARSIVTETPSEFAEGFGQGVVEAIAITNRLPSLDAALTQGALEALIGGSTTGGITAGQSVLTGTGTGTETGTGAGAGTGAAAGTGATTGTAATTGTGAAATTGGTGAGTAATTGNAGVVIATTGNTALVIDNSGVVSVVNNNTGANAGSVVTLDSTGGNITSNTGATNTNLTNSGLTNNTLTVSQDTANNINNTVNNLASTGLVTNNDVTSGAAATAVVQLAATTGTSVETVNNATNTLVNNVNAATSTTGGGTNLGVVIAADATTGQVLVADTTGNTQIVNAGTGVNVGSTVNLTTDTQTGGTVANNVTAAPATTAQVTAAPETTAAPATTTTPETTAAPETTPEVQPEVTPETTPTTTPETTPTTTPETTPTTTPTTTPVATPEREDEITAELLRLIELESQPPVPGVPEVQIDQVVREQGPTTEPPKEEGAKTGRQTTRLGGGVTPRGGTGIGQGLRGITQTGLQESLTSFRPAGEIRAGTGKPRRNVWNEASLRLKDALGL